MQIKNFGRALAVLTLAALGASAQAAPQMMSKMMPRTAVVKIAASQPAAIVKLGGALLEEYAGGDPASRTTTYRGGESAKQSVLPSKPQPRS